MKKLFLFLILIFLLIFLLYKINQKDEIKIGFVGALTAKYSVLGNAMMNGIILAFEEENYEINNQKIKLIFKDDKQDSKINKEIVNDFIAQDVKIIIGNVTSSMSKVTMSIVNQHRDMFMISAASASNEFSGIDDQFFRVHVANNHQRFRNFAKYIKDNGFKNIYGIYDPKNKTYTRDYLENFEKSWILGGSDKFIKYEKSDIALDELVKDVNLKKPDLILMCVNSVDAAKLVQYLRLNSINTQVASSEWAMTNTFLENSGKFSEDVIFNIDYDEKSKNQKFLEFVRNYKNKYNINPSMYASKAYELAKIIIELLKTGDETELKKNLLIKKEFEGLQDTIIFDKYGDVIRTFNTFKVKDGEFIKINE